MGPPPQTPRAAAGSSRGRPRCRSVPGASVLEHCLDLELNRDLVAHHGATGLHDRGEVDAEVTPVDLADGGEPRPGAAVRVRAEAVRLQGQLHLLGYALEREVAVEDVHVAVLADAG